MNRETWLTPSYNNTGQVRHAFLIGTTNAEILTGQVKQEHVDFDDIIQFSFIPEFNAEDIDGFLSGQLNFVVTHILL